MWSGPCVLSRVLCSETARRMVHGATSTTCRITPQTPVHARPREISSCTRCAIQHFWAVCQRTQLSTEPPSRSIRFTCISWQQRIAKSVVTHLLFFFQCRFLSYLRDCSAWNSTNRTEILLKSSAVPFISICGASTYRAIIGSWLNGSDAGVGLYLWAMTSVTLEPP